MRVAQKTGWSNPALTVKKPLADVNPTVAGWSPVAVVPSRVAARSVTTTFAEKGGCAAF